MNKSIFLILFFLTGAKTFPAPTCTNLFQHETRQKSVFFSLLLKKLESSRIKETDIQIQVSSDGLLIDLKNFVSKDLDQIEILIKVKGKAAVTIELDRRFLNGHRLNAFQTHSTLEDPTFSNMGLGTLGYLIAARIAHDYFSSQLFSTRKPFATTALPLWRRLVDFGMASYSNDPHEVSQTGIVSSQRFSILDDVFNTGENDFIDRIIEK